MQAISHWRRLAGTHYCSPAFTMNVARKRSTERTAIRSNQTYQSWVPTSRLTEARWDGIARSTGGGEPCRVPSAVRRSGGVRSDDYEIYLPVPLPPSDIFPSSIMIWPSCSCNSFPFFINILPFILTFVPLDRVVSRSIGPTSF